VKLGDTDFNRLFADALSEDTAGRTKALSLLGRNLVLKHTKQFAKTLELLLADGEFDVTGWNKLAVEVIVDVCSRQKRTFRFTKNGKTISIARFPEGPMKDIFVRDLTEEPW
jgi:hypothetical protein